MNHRFSQIMVLAAVLIIMAAMIPTSAMATTNTTAGTEIVNRAQISYKVGGISQTAVTNGTAFLVGRKYDLLVSWQDGSSISANAGDLYKSLIFNTTNLGNDTFDFFLTLTSNTNASIQNVAMTVDDAVCETTDPLLAQDATYGYILNDVAIGVSNRICVFYNISNSVPNNTTLPIIMIANAGLGSSAAGSGFQAETGGAFANNLIQVLYTDIAGDADSAKDRMHSDMGSFSIAAPIISVTKTATVVSDPAGSASPKAVPGAVIEYRVTVRNDGAALANSVEIYDDMSALHNSIIFVNHTSAYWNASANAATIPQNSSGFVTNAGGIINVGVGDLPGFTNSASLVFRVQIQ